jgi:hypothetical protein
MPYSLTNSTDECSAVKFHVHTTKYKRLGKFITYKRKSISYREKHTTSGISFKSLQTACQINNTTLELTTTAAVIDKWGG